MPDQQVNQQQVANEGKEVIEKDRRYVWHHMSPYKKDADPMVVAKAKGAWIEDIAGNRYLDGMSGLWCVNSGYGRQELADAAYEQLQTMPYYPMTQANIPAVQLAEKLNRWLLREDGDSQGNPRRDEYKIFFSNSGSEANETAFKIARQYHAQNGESGRFKFISRYRAYHGNSMGSMAATGQAQRKYLYEPLAPGFLHVPPPDCYRCPFGKSRETCGMECAQVFDQTITWEKPETVAAVIMEPIITGGGVIVPPEGYLKKVQDICRKHGVLLIVDEVICGFGRTGKRFGFQHEEVKPDIVTMAKGITSGYLPLSATAVRSELFEAFTGQEENDFFRHVNTFGGNASASALAARNLQLMEEERLPERSAELGSQLLQACDDLRDHPNVGDIRGKGLLLGIELVEDKESKEPASPAKVAQVIGECKKRGLIVGRNGDTVSGFNNIIALSPPLSITDEDFLFIVKTLKEAIHSL